jgi:DNA-binding transcriptional ArsR family regulator
MRREPEFTIQQVANRSGQVYGTAHKYIEALKQWDYVTCTEPRLPTEKHKAAKYRLAMNTGPHAPAPHATGIDDPNLDPALLDGLTKCWLAMRQVQRFDSPTLQTQTGLPQRTVEAYLNKFLRAGIVAVQQERKSGSPLGSVRTYALVQNPGPLAPVFRRDGTVFDPNTAQDLTPIGEPVHV